MTQATADYNGQNKRPPTAKPHANGDSGNATAAHHVAPVRPHQQHIHLQQQPQQPQARATMPLSGMNPPVPMPNSGAAMAPNGGMSSTGAVVGNAPAGGPVGMRMVPTGNGMDWVFC